MIDSDDKINEDISASSDGKEERTAERKAPAADHVCGLHVEVTGEMERA